MKTALLLVFALTTTTASAQFGIRAATAGFSYTAMSGDLVGIRAAVAEPSTGFSEGSLFKSASGFVFAYPEMKMPTAVESEIEIPDVVPERFELDQNYPNPFNPVTNILVSVPERSQMRLEVYNSIGQLISVLADDQFEAGRHRFTWNAKDETGRAVASGTYIYRIVAGEFHQTRTMILLK
jgi:hypothetical protein